MNDGTSLRKARPGFCRSWKSVRDANRNANRRFDMELMGCDTYVCTRTVTGRKLLEDERRYDLLRCRYVEKLIERAAGHREANNRFEEKSVCFAWV